MAWCRRTSGCPDRSPSRSPSTDAGRRLPHPARGAPAGSRGDRGGRPARPSPPSPPPPPVAPPPPLRGGPPGILVPPPCGFGISTARTGGGKQVPEESRFQILYRLFFRSDSNSAIVTASTPGAPLLALTFSHASQTACFEIANGLPGASSSSIRFLPEHFRLTRRIKPR